MSLSLGSTIKLSSGHTIPRLGYGVYQARGQECQDGVETALRAGYRHVDSAQAYRNEDLVRAGVEAFKVPRSEIFLTTKYMATHRAYPTAAVYKYLLSSRTKLCGDAPGSSGGYIDLFLIHAPFGGAEGRANSWAALAQAQKEGWVRDIGVSNFGVKHLEALPSPVPAVNQIELHPWCQQRDIVQYCESHGIVVQAYSPIVRADPARFADPVIQSLTAKHHKTPAQILIRWSLQKGYVPLPKSVRPERIRSNADVYGFELDKEDMAALDGLDQGSKGAITWNPVDQD
ncbi:putative aldo-keto reductase [Papiliotrema laurentii]|uniref:Aldo-keto reductase n=1 Tax=Papiliotrema laurentii TaxID=5418 RepID=A0AAD9FPV7_PAPLA|nr:putative aldo-keto reductase [Papiliotrema laurentii]